MKVLCLSGGENGIEMKKKMNVRKNVREEVRKYVIICARRMCSRREEHTCHVSVKVRMDGIIDETMLPDVIARSVKSTFIDS